MNCSYCYEPLDEEELEAPMEEAGEIMCDDCHREKYEFLCPICEIFVNLEGNEDHLIVVPGPYPKEAELEPGIYLIKDRTWDVLRCEWEKVASFPEKCKEEESNIEVCEDCVKEVVKKEKDIRTFETELSGAIFSECRKYRYALWRRWNPQKGSCMVIGINPSTADESKDDNTIRRCIWFAKKFGYGSLVMTNLFAFRATDPKEMKGAMNPYGPDNSEWLRYFALRADCVIAAWGTHGVFRSRDKGVKRLLGKMSCLGKTKEGHPKHPLYLSKETELIEY